MSIEGCVQPGGHGTGDPRSFDFQRFFGVLRRTGYNGRVSVECGWRGDFKQVGPATVKWLREQWPTADGLK